MHVFLIAALSVDGFIAKSTSHAASWTSKEDKQFFAERTKAAGVVVMGRTTYETIGKPLPGRENIIYSRGAFQAQGIKVTSEAPRELINDLSAKGCQEIAIIGGAQIYTLFMAAGVVNTLYLTVEPVIFGQGISLFTQPISVSLELVAAKQLGSQTVVNEYRVSSFS